MAATAYDAAEALSSVAEKLHAASSASDSLPALFALTDPDRTPDVVAFAKSLPEGAGIILRHFGQPGPRMASMDLATVASDRKLVYLIGADPELAAIVGAKGVHWPERMPAEAASYRRHQPERMMTMAAHGAEGLAAAKEAAADAVLLGPVFPTDSASTNPPIGVERFAELVASTDLPVYALGGVTGENVEQLLGTGACGVAAVSAFLS
jgi:thiamine-phosphate pyrophosphorylase